MTVTIIPRYGALDHFSKWWNAEGHKIADRHELASLAFDLGHAAHHAETEYSTHPLATLIAAPIASDDLQWTENEKDHLRELEPKPLVFNMINPLLVPR